MHQIINLLQLLLLANVVNARLGQASTRRLQLDQTDMLEDLEVKAEAEKLAMELEFDVAEEEFFEVELHGDISAGIVTESSVSSETESASEDDNDPTVENESLEDMVLETEAEKKAKEREFAEAEDAFDGEIPVVTNDETASDSEDEFDSTLEGMVLKAEADKAKQEREFAEAEDAFDGEIPVVTNDETDSSSEDEFDPTDSETIELDAEAEELANELEKIEGENEPFEDMVLKAEADKAKQEREFAEAEDAFDGEIPIVTNDETDSGSEDEFDPTDSEEIELNAEAEELANELEKIEGSFDIATEEPTAYETADPTTDNSYIATDQSSEASSEVETNFDIDKEFMHVSENVIDETNVEDETIIDLDFDSVPTEEPTSEEASTESSATEEPTSLNTDGTVDEIDEEFTNGTENAVDEIDVEDEIIHDLDFEPVPFGTEESTSEESSDFYIATYEPTSFETTEGSDYDTALTEELTSEEAPTESSATEEPTSLITDGTVDEIDEEFTNGTENVVEEIDVEDEIIHDLDFEPVPLGTEEPTSEDASTESSDVSTDALSGSI